MLLSVNLIIGILTKLPRTSGRRRVSHSVTRSRETGGTRTRGCASPSARMASAYASRFGAAGWDRHRRCADDDAGTPPTARWVTGCGLVDSNDGCTIFLTSAGGTGHFHRRDTWSDTLTEDPKYKRLVSTSRTRSQAPTKNPHTYGAGYSGKDKVLNLNGNDVSTILLTPGPAWPIDRMDPFVSSIAP